MSRRRTYTVAFDLPPEKIHQDLTSPEYWHGLIEVYREFTPSELTSLGTDDGGIDVEFVHNLPRSDLPAVARHALPTDVVVTRRQRLDTFDHSRNRATGTYSASIPHAPGRLSGQYALTETATGSRLQYESVCKVWVPLIGGSVEEMILDGITDLFDGERRFTADWIAERH
ncbi:DUF2505 domain-containing protein [Mycobacterium sp. IDR2000157661]|uniref:DUF2505 domain-containing protein n=1 Tax=Mycobacterium sp. IDR2000157661 TaxID=2867005 RepID=UPI001EEB8203|nr:DUF2505 domain-containing protein [Mycobacterium sp. IDR2000157661]ULE34215.1 DUF2505 domain-containing protein [Mycobacterium sp. IDR2000157661]